MGQSAKGQIAMNNEDPTTVLFPEPVSENLGVEDIGIMNSCSDTTEQCVPVESSRLDAMMTKENLADKRLNILLIDVEGYDFDVILGGNTTLRNTEYIEFEYHHVGTVSSHRSELSSFSTHCHASTLHESEYPGPSKPTTGSGERNLQWASSQSR
jgi:Methyltransferase FkbM domain